MNKAGVVKRLHYLSQYLPITGYTLLYVAIGGAGRHFLYPRDSAAGLSAFSPFVLLMARLAFWFVVCLMTLSIISALLCWLYFLWLRKKGMSSLSLGFTAWQEEAQGRVRLSASLPKVFKPLLGYVSLRLVYDDERITESFSLFSGRRKKASVLPEHTSGTGMIQLPYIKTYRISGAFVHFFDMLRMVSLPVHETLNESFYQAPSRAGGEITTVRPSTTEMPDTRIEEMRRVQGELTQYKDFEPGDDVRRIVWKVFAKNRDLVVRIPERFEPYASHLNVYASFSNSFSWLSEGQNYHSLLHEYKQEMWRIYRQLEQQGWELRFHCDQPIVSAQHLSPTEQVAYTIANSNFQTTHSVKDLLTRSSGAVLIISSLCPPQEVAAALDAYQNNTMVFLVKLSNVFNHSWPSSLLTRLFLLPPNSEGLVKEQNWSTYLLKRKIKSQEALLQEVVNRLGK